MNRRHNHVGILLCCVLGFGLSANAWGVETVPGGLYLHPLPEGIVRAEYLDVPVLIVNSVAGGR